MNRESKVREHFPVNDLVNLNGLGRGVKIAIMDTGIDYYHKALGGCFGPGCKVSFGKDFIGDTYDQTGIPVTDDDPLATCVGGGHGTHVAGQ